MLDSCAYVVAVMLGLNAYFTWYLKILMEFVRFLVMKNLAIVILCEQEIEL